MAGYDFAAVTHFTKAMVSEPKGVGSVVWRLAPSAKRCRSTCDFRPCKRSRLTQLLEYGSHPYSPFRRGRCSACAKLPDPERCDLTRRVSIHNDLIEQRNALHKCRRPCRSSAHTNTLGKGTCPARKLTKCHRLKNASASETSVWRRRRRVAPDCAPRQSDTSAGPQGEGRAAAQSSTILHTEMICFPLRGRDGSGEPFPRHSPRIP